jgi:hypothetical protein
MTKTGKGGEKKRPRRERKKTRGKDDEGGRGRNKRNEIHRTKQQKSNKPVLT